MSSARPGMPWQMAPDLGLLTLTDFYSRLVVFLFLLDKLENILITTTFTSFSSKIGE